MPATIPPLVDPFGRRIAYLRLSVTPYCNFRCSYCQPHGPVLPVGPRDEMTPAEIERLASAFVRLGVMKIRLTGGEPTLRRDLTEIVERLAALKADGLRDLSLSTHAMFLAPLAAPLLAVAWAIPDERVGQLATCALVAGSAVTIPLDRQPVATPNAHATGTMKRCSTA